NFLDRQDRLAVLQDAGVVKLVTGGGRVLEIRPDRSGRPWTDLPPDFWVQVSVGLVAWLVSAAVFVFRPRETVARYLLLSGASTLLFAPAAAVYTTRELGMDGTVLQWASDLNFLGGSLFAASFVALLLYYPRPVAPRWAGRAVVGVFVLWFVLQQVGVFESMTFARRFLVMVAVLVTFVLAAYHWFATRREPVARAALQWFLLSWLLGTGVFALLILLPQMFGVDTSPLQGYAFLLFLLVYGGLALGILRYRLFELGPWWRRIVAWAAAALALVLLDLLFVGVLRLSSQTSLALALSICAVVWLPFRSWVWTRLTERRARGREARFSEVLEAALAPPAEGGKRWMETLQAAFDPLRMAPADATSGEVEILDDGLVMTIPPAGGGPALRLGYARGGRDLFSPRDAELAAELLAMMRHATASVSAYLRGVAEERGRIARDVHDNIGAQLLSALHSDRGESKDEQIRRTILGLREMINNAPPEPLALDEVLADLRFETAGRAEDHGLEFEWHAEEFGSARLAPAAIHALRSVLREAVSNVIRHAGARRLEVQAGRRGGRL
ncbi:sensor histidine kinase, partial [Luteolibacter marinus]|uniref:sensor histidine kinase n=1 Tax=Luteolibacter marinus TaxID=2776705 RepID=UPI0018671548